MSPIINLGLNTMKKIKSTLLALSVAASFNVSSAERDYISIVGSSTVYPFSTVVAERFGKSTDFKTPKIESTGTGGSSAMSLFIERRSVVPDRHSVL